MCRAVAAFALLTLLAQIANAASALDLTLALPHPLAAGERAWIVVQVGPIRRGQEINVATRDGQDLGTISPFAIRSGQDGGTYPLPVPPDAIHDNSIALQLTITQPNGAPRAPTAEEVRSVKLEIAGAPH